MSANIGSYETKIIRQVLMEWQLSRYPIDKILSATTREHHVGPKERGLISSGVYTFIRHWPQLLSSHWLTPHFFESNEGRRDFDAALEKILKKDHAYFLRSHEKQRPLFEERSDEHLVKVHGLPQFLVPEFCSTPSLAKAWHDYLHVSMSEAPTALRTKNIENLNATKSDWVPGAYLFSERQSFNSLLEKGSYEIQDEHSQLVSLLLAPQPHEKVLDYCAGGGGKTLHMAALMNGGGEIYAYDISPKKLAKLKERVREAGFNNIRALNEKPPAKYFDAVLVDAPCSGLGTLRRNADRLWTLKSAELKSLAMTQESIVHQALQCLKPGGRLLYATCTVRPEENLELLERIHKERPLQTHSLQKPLKNIMNEKMDSFLTHMRESSAYKIASHKKSIFPDDTWLQLGPSSHTSGGLQGDAFFMALVH